MSDDEGVARLGLEFDTDKAGQDADKFSEKLDNVGKHAATMGDALQRGIEKVKQGLEYLGLGFGLLKLSESMQEAIQLAARFETLGQVLNRVGAQAGYSQSQLNGLTAALQRTGITMIESRAALVDMIQANLDLASATKLARVAQDAAVTANLNSSETFKRVIYGIESGNSEILRTIGLSVNWNDAYTRMAATLGVAADELTDVERSQARANEVMHAGVQISGAYETAMGTASKQMRSMERYAEDLKVRLGEAFQPMFTTVVFGFAKVLEVAADHARVLSVVIAALAGRGLGLMISRGYDLVKSIIASNAALSAETKATLETAAAQGTLSLTQNAAAISAVRLAQAEAAAAESVTLFGKALRILGGWPGLILTAGAALMSMFSTMASGDNIVQKYSGSMDRLGSEVQKTAKAFEDLAKKRHEALGNDNEDEKQIKKDIKKLSDDQHQAVFDQANPAKLSTFAKVYAQNWKFDDATDQANDLLAKGGMDNAYKALDVVERQADLYSTKLRELGKSDPDAVAYLNDMNERINAQVNAYRQLVVTMEQSQKATKDQTAANEQLALSNDKVTRSLGIAANDAKAKIYALRTGGVLGGEAADRSISEQAQMRATFEQQKNIYTPNMQELRYEQVAGASEAQMRTLAENAAAGARRGTDRTAYLQGRDGIEAVNELMRGLRNLVAAMRADATFIVSSGNDQHTAELIEQQQSYDRANLITRGSASDQDILAGVYRGAHGANVTAQVDALRIKIAGLAAARSLDAKASDAQRAAAGAAAEVLARSTMHAQQAETAQTELTKARTAAIDAEEMRAAYAQGPQAVADAQRRIQMRNLALPGGALYAASDKDRTQYALDQETSKMADAAKAVATVHEQADAQERLAQVAGVSKDAMARVTAENEVYQQVAAMGLTTDDARIVRANLLTEKLRELAAQQHANNEQTSREAQFNIALTQQEIAATRQGMLAEQQFQITKAGLVARNNTVGSDADKAQAQTDAETQERLKIMLQRAQDAAHAMVQPFLDALNQVQGAFSSTFEKILNKGYQTWQQMSTDLVNSIKSALARMVVSEITNAIVQKIKDAYHRATDSAALGAPDGQMGGFAGYGVGSGFSLAAMSPLLIDIGGGNNGGAASSGGGGIGQTIQTLGALKGLMGKGGFAMPTGLNGLGASMLATAGEAAGMGVAGWSIGESMGSMTTNKFVGALGGAAGGAASGAAIGMMGGPIGAMAGAIIGGLSGAISGFIHVGSMSHDAARKLQEGRDALANSIDAFGSVATKTNSILGDALRQNEQERQSLVAAANNDLPGKKYEGERNKRINEINQDAATGAANIVKDFWISIDQQLAAAQGTTFQATLYNLKLAYENNQRSAEKAGASTEQLSEITQLYTVQVEKATRAHNIEIDSAKNSLDARMLDAKGASYAADMLKMYVDQQKELNDALDKWGATNPEIIDQIKQVQAAETERAQRLQQQDMEQTQGDYAVRALAASGASVLSDKLNLQLEQQKELQDAMDKWAATNPVLIQQLQAVQQMESDRAARLQAQDLAQTKGQIEVQMLQARGATFEASQLQLRLDQQQQLNDAIEKWGATNPEIIDQLKQVQALQRANAAESLSSTVRNGPGDFKVANYAYLAANTTSLDQLLAGLAPFPPQTSMPDSTSILSQFTNGVSNVDMSGVSSLLATLNQSISDLTDAAKAPSSPQIVQPISIPPGGIIVQGGPDKSPDQLAEELLAEFRMRAVAIGGAGAKIVDTIDQMN